MSRTYMHKSGFCAHTFYAGRGALYIQDDFVYSKHYRFLREFSRNRKTTTGKFRASSGVHENRVVDVFVCPKSSL